MDLYFNSLLFIIIGSLFVIPLIIFKGTAKYAPFLFYIILLLATILRPNILGIDNFNFINSITQKENLISNNISIKYSTIYYLTYFIPGTWQKLVGLNLLSTLITIFSIRRLFKIIKFQSKTTYIYLLYMSYTLIIACPLILIHARQFFCFALTTIFLNLYRSYKRKIILYEIILSFLISATHPVYISFLVFYFICKYFRKTIINLIYNSSNFSKVSILLFAIYPIIFVYNNINFFYINIASSLEGFRSYGVQLVANPNTSVITRFYLIFLIFPIIFIYINCLKNNDAKILFSVLLTYIIFTIPFLLLEFKLNYLYSINRVKTGLYPAILLILFHLERIRISKNVLLLVTIFLTGYNTYLIFRLAQKL